MYDIEQHMPEVRPEVPGCPDQQIERAILMAARDFCGDTWVWREDVAGGAEITSETESHAIYQPHDADILGIVSVSVNGQPQRYSWDQERTITVRGSGVFHAIAALQPDITADQLPDVLRRYEEAITAGAKYRLMRIPGVEWSSPDLAIHYKREYGNGVGRARLDAARSNSAGGMTANAPRFI